MASHSFAESGEIGAEQEDDDDMLVAPHCSSAKVSAQAARDACFDSLEIMTRYYEAQGICSADEWASAVKSFQLPWCVTGRINPSSGLCRYTRSSLKKASQLPGLLQGEALLVGDASVVQPSDDKALHALLILLKKTGEFETQELPSMLPALLLEAQSSHLVLDLCAAPGSKTLHLLDSMHRDLATHEVPTGLLVANDVDATRLWKLIGRSRPHRVSPLVCTCCVGQDFPTLTSSANADGAFAPWTPPSAEHPEGQFKLRFDRILCDVPCSGDGGVRKGFRAAWTANNSLALHPKQVGLLQRGFELLRPGGSLLYSTCSLNPIENEAVIATLLAGRKGKVEVVAETFERVRSCLPCSRGIKHWKVPDPDYLGDIDDEGADFYASFQETPPLLRGGKVKATMFPPSDDGTETAWLRAQLANCVRVLPGAHNGGFFVALIQKPAHTLNEENGEDPELKEDSDVATTPAAGNIELHNGSLDSKGGDVCSGYAGNGHEPLACQQVEAAQHKEITAGCRVLVRATGGIATVIGPGSGKYKGLVKIRYPDKATYHASVSDLDLQENGLARTSQPSNSAAPGSTSSKRVKKPGMKLIRCLGLKSPTVDLLAEFWGLPRHACQPSSQACDLFPWHLLSYKPHDKTTLYMASRSLLQLRMPPRLKVPAYGLPCFRRVEGAKDMARWGKQCPLRPCDEAAQLLGRFATRRRLILHLEPWLQLLASRSVTLEVLRSLQDADKLLGLESCFVEASEVPPAREREVVHGAVVLVLSKQASAASAAEEAEDDTKIAIVGALGSGGLEIFLDRDICLRLADISSMSLAQDDILCFT
eukprot:TRINITY_DN52730_c0_g3_i2.p1 TRINITY_DN52730_c0_g3~~TRINITY_DN52730_c0_g3_i2.p1  ORF type:complete len:821 (-),score=72.39 TRINITY_DN52730_c0_g3_i2:80-2542(-)